MENMTTKQAYLMLLTGTIIGFGLIYFSLKKMSEDIKNSNK